MRKALLFFLVSLLYGRLAAQEEFITPSRLLSRFSFEQFTGGIIILKARLDPFPDSLNFILDTGSGGISLDSTRVRKLGLKPIPTDRTIRGIAGIRKVDFLYNRTLLLPGLAVDSLHFHINDYSILTSVYGQPIDGIIGYSVLSRYIVKINYDSARLEFWSRGVLKYPRGGHLLRPLIPSTLPVQPVRVRDERTISSRFLYDLGAGMNLVLSSDFIKDSALLAPKRKLYRKEAEGLGGAIDMWITAIKEVKLGPYRFRNVPVYVFDDVNNVTSYPYMGGLLGSDLLRRFNCIINYEKKEFHLLPNGHFKDPFDYAYSGIELYYEEGKILIGDVAEGSPAAKAGLKEGDLVVAVDRNFNQHLKDYKEALQKAQGKVKVIVHRHGQVLQYEFKVKNILQGK
ncbi:aspartyl protease family protein [Paraflavisolibacter sp. H34]|uniref:aspartyl protease family protein n=1 Tax=Huijunlia imazamoxiresistens TaxID=3127457 RepID=UPI003019384B